MSASSTRASINAVTTKVVDDFAGAPRAVGVNGSSTLKHTGQRITTSITQVPANIGKRIATLDKQALAAPISPGFAINDFVNTVKQPSESGLSKALQNVTGVNVQTIANKFVSPQTIDTRVEQYFTVLQQQITQAIQDCIDKHLRAIINKNPEIEMLLNIQQAIAKEIAKIRNKIQFKIQGEIEKAAYQKIKIQQISEFKQKILGTIRNLCPNVSGKGSSKSRGLTIPASLTKKFQDDTTWKLPDGKKDVKEVARQHSIQASVNIEQPNNSAELVEDAARESVSELKKVSAAQTLRASDVQSPDEIMDDTGAILEYTDTGELVPVPSIHCIDES